MNDIERNRAAKYANVGHQATAEKVFRGREVNGEWALIAEMSDI